MKGIFIAYDLAHHENVIEVLNRCSCRGFTSLGEVQGRGSKTGDPHYGSHAWPTMNSAIITFVENDRVEKLMDMLHELDLSKPLLGLRAFAWDITHSI